MELINRLEAATGSFGPIEAWDIVEQGPFGTSGPLAELFAAALQGSLDAALALAERVLPGWHYELTPGRAEIAAEQWAYHDSAEDEGGQSASAKTTPLALCAAILKATDTGRE